MPWIETIAYKAASGRLKQLYDRVKGPGNTIDNIMKVHSLRPHSMEAHMALYKHVLHHSANTVPKWFLETLGVWVSVLNKCEYCVQHHFAGLSRLLDDDLTSDALLAAIRSGDIAAAPLDEKQKLAMHYARVLTQNPSMADERMVYDMRNSGFDDGQILEINQVIAYFAYANRTVLGLGCSTEGDTLGLSPNNSEDPDDWNHS